MNGCSCCIEAKKLISYAMKRVKGFTILDYSILKACLVSFGVLIGARFSKFFRKFEIFIFLAFIISYIYLIYKMFAGSED